MELHDRWDRRRRVAPRSERDVHAGRRGNLNRGAQVEARYHDQEVRAVAEELVRTYLDAWAFDHNTRLKITFHSTSELRPDGTTRHTRQVEASVALTDRVQTVVTRADGTQARYDSGSLVNEDVPEGALAVGRARQRNIPGWTSHRRRRMETAE